MSSTEFSISEAKLAANRLNALKSTGPKSDAGKAIVGKNNFRHGLTGSFAVLAWESAEDYEVLRQALQNEHQPATATEGLLVERLAQHHWLAQRALTLQTRCLESENPERHLALYLRYQTTNERAFHKCLRELAQVRVERRQEQQRREEQQKKEARAAEERRREELLRELAKDLKAEEEAERQERREKRALALNRKKAKSAQGVPVVRVGETKESSAPATRPALPDLIQICA